MRPPSTVSFAGRITPVVLLLLAARGGASAQSPDASTTGIGGTSIGSAVSAAVATTAQGAVGAAKPTPTGVLAPAPLDPITALRRKVLRDEDFAENEELNRDPFRPYLRIFSGGGSGAGVVKPHVGPPAIFEKYAVEELTLIAVISGDAKPMAMFRDPTGLGQTIKKGDYISKAAARVTKILSDRVVMEMTEDTGTGEPKITEKAILVNPEEAQP